MCRVECVECGGVRRVEEVECGGIGRVEMCVGWSVWSVECGGGGVWRYGKGGSVRVKVQGVWRKWREWLCCMCVCMSWGEGGEVEDEGEGEG